MSPTLQFKATLNLFSVLELKVKKIKRKYRMEQLIIYKKKIEKKKSMPKGA